MRDTAQRCHESNADLKGFLRRRPTDGCGWRESPSHSVKSIPDTNTPGKSALSVERPS
ncbi:hypothetical protein SAMN05421783_102100 [Thiocapsa roseopersicina]|uniref:Uncharacterized protein n=1 Tax=Thiocapsa roseopersicina TaxID=1058 RepID=A0A1H2RN43_THIRO|nr:hypothetical protein SAMN05421783_102100 [Thiocapsa roseopersicina]